MAPSLQHSTVPSVTFHVSRFTPYASRLTLRPLRVLLALLCFICAACGTTGQTGKVLFDDPRGTVSLQTISDQSIHANHPIDLDPTLVAQVLRGMEVQDQERGLQRLFSGAHAPIPVFSDDEIQFLAPLLAEGLRTATADQRIEYRVLTTIEGSMLESSTTETTAGSLYAYGRALYMTLSQYRNAPNRMQMSTGTIRPGPRDYSGLRDRILLFTPKAAQRSDSFDPPARAISTDRFLAIDYQLLQQTPPTAATTGQTAPQTGTSSMSGSPAGSSASEAQTRSTEALAHEVETLRKELQSVQKQLGNQPTTPDSPKRKTPPAKR